MTTIAFVFVVFCGIVSLIGLTVPQEKPRQPEKDYNKIYKQIMPREI